MGRRGKLELVESKHPNWRETRKKDTQIASPQKIPTGKYNTLNKWWKNTLYSCPYL